MSREKVTALASRQGTERKSEGGIHAAVPASHIAAAKMGFTHTAPWDLSHIFDEQREHVLLPFFKSLTIFSGTKEFLLASWLESYHRV